ncbi:hypothetical protein PHLGIDRAFT_75427 [Phlebiopsis gigantea 11061_1 CR5-6]|uniref:Cytochrome P450 n=1 Tax=Phlebiopsis gigantea (strain 11061_1 CR5-6) TaxID=745531 RepID=A0A0C3S407_PHLG1|nr:hypothetical protein PHLGIDRAFT_75427 [Phlebiopsis gigantea 11061_1 CR5-6]
MPPGPLGMPIFGNILQLRRSLYWGQAHRVERKMRTEGNILSINILGQHIVAINDFATSAELLGRRSGIYSDRPRLIVANKLMCNNKNPAFLPYGEHWRKVRKAGHEGFNTRAVEAYRPMQEEHAARRVSALLIDPTNIDSHIRRSAASTVLSVIYGWQALDPSMDSVMQVINNWVDKTAREAVPRHLVEIFPWMLHIPTALAPWKKWALQQRHEDRRLFQGFVEGMKDTTESKVSCCATMILANSERFGLNLEDVAWLCGGFFASSIRFFLLAMLLHPESMRRARQEIDTVVGRSRLPTFADEPNLPYISAMVKEVFRWRPVAPLNISNGRNFLVVLPLTRAKQDDWYNGYFIPKGTVVIQNIWGMNHDPAVFAGPDVFCPERYLDRNGHARYPVQDTMGFGHASFGAGRRICCGRDLAVQSLFINVATILWAADILPAKSADGKLVKTHLSLLNFHREPAPFKCVLNIRAENVLQIAGRVIHAQDT